MIVPLHIPSHHVVACVIAQQIYCQARQRFFFISLYYLRKRRICKDGMVIPWMSLLVPLRGIMKIGLIFVWHDSLSYKEWTVLFAKKETHKINNNVRTACIRRFTLRAASTIVSRCLHPMAWDNALVCKGVEHNNDTVGRKYSIADEFTTPQLSEQSLKCA